MDQSVGNIRKEQWRSLILEAGASKMTKKEWCLAHSVPIRRFYYWQKKIRDDALVQMEEMKASCDIPVLPVPQAPAPFVELPLSPDPAATDTVTEEAHPDAFRPDLILETDRCRLLIGDSAGKKTLETVLQVILHA